MITNQAATALAALGFCAALGAGCGSSERRSEPTYTTDMTAKQQLKADDDDDRMCNIGMTVCRHMPPAYVAVRAPAPESTLCKPGDGCHHVRIEAVGGADIHWDAGQSLVGVTCTLGSRGLEGEGANGYYRGQLVDCSDGASYEFEYVKVQRLDLL